jgi:hypothetical protein
MTLRHALSFSLALICRHNHKTTEGEILTVDEAIAAVTFFFPSPLSIVVTLCATSEKDYSNAFGSGNDNEPFRRRGLMIFLLKCLHNFHASVFNRPTLYNNINDGPALFVLLEKNDPSRWLFFIPTGFVFAGYSYKHLETVRDGCSMPGVSFPFAGNEILYVRYYGKVHL